MQVLRVRQAPWPAGGRQLSESKSLLPSSSLFSGDALDDVLFHFSAFSDSSDEDRFCRLHLARRFLNQTCGAKAGKQLKSKACCPRAGASRGSVGLGPRDAPALAPTKRKEARSRFRLFLKLPGPKAPSSSRRASTGVFLGAGRPQRGPGKTGWGGGYYLQRAFKRTQQRLVPTSTFSSRRCTFRASCSRVPTSGYLVSWKRFSSASSCSSVKMVRCRRFRRQCSWLRSCSSVRDSVPTFM